MTLYQRWQGRFIHKAEEAEASGPTKPRGHQDQYNTDNSWENKMAITLFGSQTLNLHYLLESTRNSRFDRIKNNGWWESAQSFHIIVLRHNTPCVVILLTPK